LRDEKQKQDADSVDVQLRYAALDGSPHQKNIVLQVREGVFAEQQFEAQMSRLRVICSLQKIVRFSFALPIDRKPLC
jgi:hypothetical protein